LANFSLTSVEGGFFDVESDSPNTHVVPTKAQSKYMMKHKGKEQVEEGSSPTKVIRKWALVEAKEIQSCYNGSGWDPKSDSGQSELVWVAYLMFTK
jgi:hypothetical protein